MSAMKNQVFRLSTLFLLLLFWSRASAETSWDEDALKRTGTVDINVNRVSEVACALSRIFQEPVCIEESRWFGREGESVQRTKELELKRTTGFEIVASHASLESVLEQFVQKYPEYQWVYDKTNRVINLFPRYNAPADWNIERVNIATQSLAAILFEADVLDLKDHEIRFDPGRGNLAWMKSESVTIHGEHLRLRNVLNQISRQLPEPRYWVMQEIKKPGILWDGTGRVVLYELKLCPYIPFDPVQKGLHPPMGVSTLKP